MGYRTTVILYNDHAHEWENDGDLGKKIAAAMNYATGVAEPENDLGYGRVVECVHADSQTLAVLDSYTFRPLAHANWSRVETVDQVELKLLREAADRLGYRLAAKPKR